MIFQVSYLRELVIDATGYFKYHNDYNEDTALFGYSGGALEDILVSY